MMLDVIVCRLPSETTLIYESRLKTNQSDIMVDYRTKRVIRFVMVNTTQACHQLRT